MKSRVICKALIAACFFWQLGSPNVLLAQDRIPRPALDAGEIIRSAKQGSGRELTVLAPTLTAGEIDQAVLNRLMQDIAKQPETVMQELRIEENKLQDILISLSNARSFINTNEIASIRVMCDSFKQSTKEGELRVADALAAYNRRSNYTKQFIAKFYSIVVAEIENGLSPQALVSFQSYMDDRRRRMASAGNVTLGIPSHNVRSGIEAVEFHCGKPR